MPANALITIPSATWTLLTSNDVTALRLQPLGGDLYFMGTVGAVAPVGVPSDLGAPVLQSLQFLAADLTLAQLFPGVTGATRVYGYNQTGVRVSVSHA